MRRNTPSLALFIAGGILLGTGASRSAADESKVTQTPAPAKSEKEMKRWIDQLGSHQFVDRERATYELAKLGKCALPSLKEASKSPDAEVRRRARQLVEQMDPPPVRPIDPN